jgi:coproporphyrinogen III oxidase-like Fe-S oxidoreductase
MTEVRAMSAEDRGLSVYVHLPFCARKCHYCDFNSRPAPDAERARYLDALKLEIDRRAERSSAVRMRTDGVLWRRDADGV